ncbi:Glycerol-3-phosphate dehydrogenase [NAD(P)+] [hydrothermal vent metagenome]|uniref:Glycerol-3-phosphate dehydrogenase [NAD(P)+] n=1 Tax=hydrothermal vent metagenome TaxID=652676 RepID=A0A3B0RRG7_9ZZZZ
MTTRNLDLKRIRPEFMTTTINTAMSTEERFQNLVLRPIIKLQSDLFIEVFKNYITKHKNVFYDLSIEKRIDYISNAIHKDMKFRNGIKGMVIGLFTLEEYKLYIQNSSALNKRMMNIAKECIIDNVQVINLESKALTAV